MTRALSGDLDEERLARLLSTLEPTLRECSPKSGVDRFLKNKEPEITPATAQEYKRKLDYFLEFCERHGIDDLRELDGRTIDDYKFWRRNESSDEVDELAPKTMKDDLLLLRACVSYWEDIEAVKPTLSDSVTIPELNSGEGVRDVEIKNDRASQIVNYLSKYQYATLDHVVFLLLSRTGRRTGCIQSLDCEHAHLNDDAPSLEFRNLPPETSLKNGEKSEGYVAISEEVAQVVKDYIENSRPGVTDGQGRSPLLATKYGRVSKSTIQRIIYAWSRPCEIGEGCPHDRDTSECKAAQTRNHASKCPSSQGPHALKHGYISECRRKGVPIDMVSERCDVNEECLRKHYDESTQEERCEIRRQVLEEYANDEAGGYL